MKGIGERRRHGVCAQPGRPAGQRRVPEGTGCRNPGHAIGEHEAGAGVLKNAQQARQLTRVAQGHDGNSHQPREEAGQDGFDEVEAGLVEQDRALAGAGQRLQLTGNGLSPSRELAEGQRLFRAVLPEKDVSRRVRPFNRMKK